MLIITSSFDPRKSSICHTSYKAGTLAKRQRMSKTSIIFVFISLFDPLESLNFPISSKHIKEIMKKTSLCKNTCISKIYILKQTKYQHFDLPKLLLETTLIFLSQKNKSHRKFNNKKSKTRHLQEHY